MYHVNTGTRDKLKALGTDFCYEEHPGKHDWDYFVPNMERAIGWLPLKRDYV